MKEQLRWTVLLLMIACMTIVTIAAAQNPKGSCWHETKLDFVAGVKGIPAGIENIPGGVIRGDYKWLLPVGLATGLLIGTHADQRASRHITSRSSEQTSVNFSNALIGVELGSAGLTYLVGCRAGGKSHARSAGFHALEAAGYALAADGILKAAFRREYPYTSGGDGRFWHGGGSFFFLDIQVTPNHHELARRFGLFDHFYVNAEVNSQGHIWSTAAYTARR